MTRITEHIGDIFSVPKDSILIHACNCQGAWGTGVAAAMKSKFPAAYQVYYDHCLVLDTPADEKRSGSYWIACLFTSVNYGRYADKPDTILDSTRKALLDLRKKIQTKETVAKLDFARKLYGVRINGKAFKTPWKMTRSVLEICGLEIKIMNNLDIMDDKESKLVLGQMEEWGFDVENVKKYKAALSAQGNFKAEDKKADVKDHDGDEKDKAQSSEVMKRKEEEDRKIQQADEGEIKKKRKKVDERKEGADVQEKRKKSKKHADPSSAEP